MPHDTLPATGPWDALRNGGVPSVMTHRKKRAAGTGAGLGIGVAFGVLIGMALDNLGLGIALGVALGVGAGGLMNLRKKSP